MTYRTRALIKAMVGLVLVAGLGVFAYFGIYRDARDAVRAEVEAKLALDVYKDKVVELVLERGDERVVLERAGTGSDKMPAWEMVEPVRAAGDGLVVNALLGVLERMDAERRLGPSEITSLAAYGLDKPRARWSWKNADGQSSGLSVGVKSTFNNNLYIQVAGADSVILVKGHLEESLFKNAFELRSKELMVIEPSRVTGMVLDDGENRTELAKEAGSWRLLSPLKDDADEDQVQRLLNTLRNLRATAFPSGKAGLPAYGFEPPVAKVTLFAGPAGERQEMWFGRGSLPSNKNKAYAKRFEPEGPLAEIRDYQVETFIKTPFELQAKAPIAFDRNRVAKIKSARDGALLVLEKSVEKRAAQEGGPPKTIERWALVSPAAAPAKTYKVNSVLTGLANLKAKRFVGPISGDSLEQHGLANPRQTISLFDENGKEIGKLSVGSKTPEGALVMGSSRDKVCLVDAARLENLPLSIDLLRDGPAPAAKPVAKNP